MELIVPFSVTVEIRDDICKSTQHSIFKSYFHPLSDSVIKILLLEDNQLMGKLPLEILRREDEGTQNILSSYLAMLVPLCLEKDFRELGLSEQW